MKPAGRGALPVALASFVALGLPDGMLGVAWPSIRTHFGQPLAGLGLLLVCGTCGYLAGSAASGFVADRLGTAAVLAGGFAASAAATLTYAAAPTWPALMAASALLGLGSSSIDAGGNAFVAVHHSVRTVNLLHACYGVGASVGPAALTALLASGMTWRVGYAGVCAVEVTLLAAVVLTWRSWLAGRPAAGSRREPAGRIPLALVGATLAMFFVYTAIEVGAGQWSYTFLVAGRASAAPAAGLAVSAYWASLTLGRFLAALAGGRLGPLRLLHLSVALTVGATLLYWWAPAAPLAFAALAGLGLGLAPFFPALVTLTPRRVGARAVARVVGFQLAAAGAGASLGPAAMGVVLQQAGIGLLGPCLAAGAVLLAGIHLATACAANS
jgi:fucose permease